MRDVWELETHLVQLVAADGCAKTLWQLDRHAALVGLCCSGAEDLGDLPERRQRAFQGRAPAGLWQMIRLALGDV